MIRLFAAFMLAMALSLAAFSVAVDEKPLEDPKLEAQARALMKELRCLVCQNQSIEDSNADVARDLRLLVRERLAMGDTPDNVRAYLVDRYGDWLLLDPPVKASTYALWGSPFIILILVLLFVLRSRTPATAAEALSDDEEKRLRAILGDDGGNSSGGGA